MKSKDIHKSSTRMQPTSKYMEKKSCWWETPWKKINLHFSLQERNEPVLPFPHCCLLLREQLQEQHCLTSVACARGRCSGTFPDVLGNQRCWQCPGQPASLHTPSPQYTAPPGSSCTWCLCRNAGEQPHGDGFSAHSGAILINLATQEGAELSMQADCCKLPGSGYKLKKSSEITCKA